MVTISEILLFLNEIDEQTVWLGDQQHRNHHILTVSRDFEAEAGSLAWISKTRILQNPDAPFNYNGSLLIAPFFDGNSSLPIVCCDNPKLVFALIFKRFFSHMAEINWENSSSKPTNAKIDSSAKMSPNVVISDNVVIEKNVTIGPNTVIANAMIGSGTSIGANCTIGLPGFGYVKDKQDVYHRFPHIGKVIIGRSVEIGSNTCIDRGSLGNTIIRDGAKIDNLVHVAHNVEIKENTVVIANSMLGGSVRLGENTWIAPSVSIMNQASIGHSSIIGLGAVVLKDVEACSVVVGNPGRVIRKVTNIDDGKR